MRRPGRMLAVATAVYGGTWAYLVWLPPNGGDNPAAFLLYFGAIPYLLVWFVAAVNMIALWRDKRSGGQRRPGVSGQASRCLPAAAVGGQLPPADPRHRHTAQAARRRLLRPSLPGGRCAADVLAAGTAGR